jgi:N-acetylmuramoyl-L-alanine amidase
MKSLFVAFGLLMSGLSVGQELPAKLFRTKGALVYMEYGLGDDRLGGAKMGYLDSNILIRVKDSVNGDYKVQLSRNHEAYIPKSNLRPVQDVFPRSYYLSSNFRVFGDSAADYVSISLDEKLPYRSQQTIGQTGIIVDIFGVTSNTNWITQLGSSREILNTWYEQIEDDVMRVHIRLKHNLHWGHSIYYDSLQSRLFVKVKRPPAGGLKNWKIAIDAGHGGTNLGAAGSTTRVLEKDYTLKMARELEVAFKKAGVKNVYMTRRIDTTLSMEERIVPLRKENPDLLISIHLNSSGVDSIKGTSTFYRYVGFRPLSQDILKRMLELGLKEYGNVGSFNFALSGPVEYPNCLVEVAFLSNREDEKKIIDPKFHKAVAKKIVDGVKDFSKRK